MLYDGPFNLALRQSHIVTVGLRAKDSTLVFKAHFVIRDTVTSNTTYIAKTCVDLVIGTLRDRGVYRRGRTRQLVRYYFLRRTRVSGL